MLNVLVNILLQNRFLLFCWVVVFGFFFFERDMVFFFPVIRFDILRHLYI